MINVFDFFCGCGGTSAGLRKSGMHIAAGIDYDKNAITTYSKNFPEAQSLNVDIRELKLCTIEKIISQLDEGPLVFAACAPCQPFSKQNRYKKTNDERICLLDEFHRFVVHFKPDYIILENVPGMQKIKEGPFTRFLNLLNKYNYEYDYDIKNAMNYGVPQSRRRLVLIASKNGAIKLPEETFGPNKLPYKTIKEYIEKYPPIKAGESFLGIPNHQCAKLSSMLLKRISVLKEGEDRRCWSDDLKLRCHSKHKGHTDVYGRLSWNKPSITLTTKCISLSNGRFGHPEQNRALSVREAAAIQTFDDSFIFCGNLGATAKQVGNAVPVDFAAAIGKQILIHVEEQNNGKI